MFVNFYRPHNGIIKYTMTIIGLFALPDIVALNYENSQNIAYCVLKVVYNQW